MVQDDQNQMCSNNSNSVDGGGGSKSSSSSKKLKQNKVPQRGLGVAQLEKIRIEEKQKKDTSNTTNFSSPSTHNKQSKSLISFRPSSPSSDLPLPNPILRSFSVPDMGNFHCDSIHPLYPTNVGHGNMNVSFPMLWHPYEFKHDTKGENSRFDNNGFSFRPNSSLPYESCPIGPLPDVVPRGQQYQQPSSLVNISSVNHTSSSVLSFHMEPPSCQSYGSSYSPMWPDEEKRSIEDIIMDSGQGEPSHRPNFFNFFPEKKMQLASVPLPTSRNNFNGEVEESIDLSLRL